MNNKCDKSETFIVLAPDLANDWVDRLQPQTDRNKYLIGDIRWLEIY